MSRILIVDDIEAMREQYAYDIKRLGEHDTFVAAAGDEALQIIEREPVDCMILDLEMPRVDGFEVLSTLRHRKVDIPVIVYTGTGSIDRCVRAMKLGAFGFIEKNDAIERVLLEIEKAVKSSRDRRELKRARKKAGAGIEMVGDSKPMSDLKAAIGRLAPVPSTVLVLGESGSGKELVAQRLHELSERSGSFLAVNCAAFPEQTLEDELFGHVKGAFTGADFPRKGAFEEAAEGTLFLDEIGDLAMPAQAKLLRVLEQKQIQRLGSSQPLTVDVRVVAATHRDLHAEAKDGRFRQDLFFRLNVHSLRVPPLRERLADIAALAESLLERICSSFGMPLKKLAPETLAGLRRYDWSQNNVRELRNTLERMVIASDADTISPEAIPVEIWTVGENEEPGKEARSFRDRRLCAEREIVLDALARNANHLTNTANDLDLADHSSLIKLMRRLGIEHKR